MRRYPGAALFISVYDLRECPRLRAMTRDPAADCFVPDPFTTRGEARAAAVYARDHDLHSMTIVTTADQLVRARLRFSRCFPGPIRLVEAGSSVGFRVVRLAYQNAAMIKALVWQREC